MTYADIDKIADRPTDVDNLYSTRRGKERGGGVVRRGRVRSAGKIKNAGSVPIYLNKQPIDASSAPPPPLPRSATGVLKIARSPQSDLGTTDEDD